MDTLEVRYPGVFAGGDFYAYPGPRVTIQEPSRAGRQAKEEYGDLLDLWFGDEAKAANVPSSDRREGLRGAPGTGLAARIVVSPYPRFFVDRASQFIHSGLLRGGAVAGAGMGARGMKCWRGSLVSGFDR
ncbi:MAG TPA: hypothetical protein VLD62_07420 [Acidimicrobiia bacterium]|nr:hypothetical protein [Acidimicrobiia bacterium]